MLFTMIFAILSCPILNYNNFITIQMHNSHKENTTKSDTTDSSTILYFRRTCEQIQQEIQSLLATMSAQKIPELTHRSMEKYILSFKQAVIRSISSRLPNILAAEQKYHTIITQVNDETEIQKKKMKEFYQKYEEGILQIDRLKIQTVSVNQLYQSIKSQNQNLHAKISQLTDGLAKRDQQIHSLLQKHKGDRQKFQKQSLQLIKYKQIKHSEYGAQANDPECMFIDKKDYEYLHSKIQQQKQQKQLYHQQLSKNLSQIDELKANLLTANHHIQQLYSQNKQIMFMAESEQQSNKLLKQQIGELLLKIQERQEKNKENQVQCAIHQQTEKELTDKIKSYDEQINKMNAKMIQKDKQMAENEIKKEEMLQGKTKLIGQLQKLVEQMRKQKQMKEEQIAILKKQQQKFINLSKNKQILEQKFVKKFNLLQKINHQLHDKNKHLKNENERLYTAMDQYASNQLKMNKKIMENQIKLKKQQEKLNAFSKVRANILNILRDMQRQLAILKKQCKNGWIGRNLRQMMEEIKEFNQKIVQRVSRRLQSHHEQWYKEQKMYMQKIQTLTLQYKQLQQKCLQSQINSGKVASSLLDAKKQVTKQILQKDQIIRSLSDQLQKQKQINESSLRKLGQVVHRYSKYQHGQQHSGMSSYDGQLQKQLQMQKTRYLGLQREYEQLLHR